MPNHVTNILDVVGPAKDLKAFKKKVYKRGKDDAGDPFYSVDFEATVPMPEEIRNTTCPPQNDAEKEQQALYMKKYGAGNWYDWSRINWSTKWGSYDGCPVEESGNCLRFRFNTAWCPPVAWLETTAKLYPSLKFTDNYIDEGGGAGVITLQTVNGEFSSFHTDQEDEDWKLAFDENYKEQYGLITQGKYEEVVERYSKYKDDEYLESGLQTRLLDRLEDKDLPLFLEFEWNNHQRKTFESRLKGNKK